MTTTPGLTAAEKLRIADTAVEEEGGYISPWALNPSAGPAHSTGKEFRTYVPLALAVTGVLGVLGMSYVNRS